MLVLLVLLISKTIVLILIMADAFSVTPCSCRWNGVWNIIRDKRGRILQATALSITTQQKEVHKHLNGEVHKTIWCLVLSTSIISSLVGSFKWYHVLEVVLASDLFQTKIIFYWYDNVWQGPGTPSYHIQSLTTLLIAHVDIFDSWINLFSKLLLIVNWKRFLKEIFFWQSMVKTELGYDQCFLCKTIFRL